ncbi:hypothetical protein NSTCB13_07266 [Nostoc sp. DSM 114160]
MNCHYLTIRVEAIVFISPVDGHIQNVRVHLDTNKQYFEST